MTNVVCKDVNQELQASKMSAGDSSPAYSNEQENNEFPHSQSKSLRSVMGWVMSETESFSSLWNESVFICMPCALFITLRNDSLFALIRTIREMKDACFGSRPMKWSAESGRNKICDTFRRRKRSIMTWRWCNWIEVWLCSYSLSISLRVVSICC